MSRPDPNLSLLSLPWERDFLDPTRQTVNRVIGKEWVIQGDRDPKYVGIIAYFHFLTEILLVPISRNERHPLAGLSSRLIIYLTEFDQMPKRRI